MDTHQRYNEIDDNGASTGRIEPVEVSIVAYSLWRTRHCPWIGPPSRIYGAMAIRLSLRYDDRLSTSIASTERYTAPIETPPLADLRSGTRALRWCIVCRDPSHFGAIVGLFRL